MSVGTIDFAPQRARRTLWAGVLVFRAASFVWMVVANLLARGSLRHSAVAWSAVALTGVWTVFLTRTRSRAPRILWVDLALSVGLVLLSGYVAPPGSKRIFFATMYPASTSLAWGAARGRRLGLLAGLILGAALVVERQINGTSLANMRGDDVVSLMNAVILYLLAGGAAGVVTRTIHRSAEQMQAVVEESMRARERAGRLAQFESTARRLHDTVLQTLALLHKRARELGQRPTVTGEEVQALAAIAAQQEDELRDWIRAREPLDARGGGPIGEATASLREALVAKARTIGGVPVDVSTDGPMPMPPDRVAEIAEAVAEALRNVVKHAAASRAEVRGELQPGVAVVVVRDDGSGFAPDRRRFARERRFGLERSIRGRIESLGGTIDVRSAPGSGTEIEMRVPLDARPGSAEPFGITTSRPSE